MIYRWLSGVNMAASLFVPGCNFGLTTANPGRAGGGARQETAGRPRGKVLGKTGKNEKKGGFLNFAGGFGENGGFFGCFCGQAHKSKFFRIFTFYFTWKGVPTAVEILFPTPLWGNSAVRVLSPGVACVLGWFGGFLRFSPAKIARAAKNTKKWSNGMGACNPQTNAGRSSLYSN